MLPPTVNIGSLFAVPALDGLGTALPVIAIGVWRSVRFNLKG